MAETFLSPVIEKLIDLLIEEAKSLKGVHKQVKSLQKELEIIEPLLRDAEAKSAKGELSDTSKVWLRQLREEAERIEDIVDEYAYYAEQRSQDQESFFGSLRKVGRYVKTMKTQRDFASEIADVKDSVRDVKERGLSYGLRPFEQGGSSSGGGSSRVDPRIGSLFIEDDELVGIESESVELMRSLVEGPLERIVVSLVGEGGIGKTTLARKVYNDVVEKGCFDTHVWVTVSQSYDIDKILKTLTTQICPSGGETTTHEEAFTLLRRTLQEKRYMIVFDDVWQTDLWSVMKYVFPNSRNGSRILFTTRKSTVVKSFESPSCCEIVVKEVKTWSSEQAWKLFCKKAFPNYNCPPELEQLCDIIMKKCQGLPLAIVALAGLLSKKEKSEVEWRKVLESLNCEFEENCELSCVSKILLLSYHDLPYHLKSCLLYFGVFPEDFGVYGKRLCRIWVAEGFIGLRRDKTLEQTADEYLSELISRNLVSSESRYGSEKWCKIHDLIREVIQIRASDLCFYQLFNQNKTNFHEKVRRLVIHNTTESMLNSICDSKIRSVLLVNTAELSSSFVVSLFKNSKLLKVVEFGAAPLDVLPNEVGNLLHLKYLNLSFTNVKTLPKSVGKLRNLQTLDVRRTLVRELPIEINKLTKLRNILAYNFDMESKYSVKSNTGVRVHEGIGRLEELQTLNLMEANPGNHDFVKELQKLSKLRQLGITNVSAEMSEALGKCIEKMNNLEELSLESTNMENVIDLVSISSPPLRLCYIKLSCPLRQLPTWFSELHNLQGLRLDFSRLVDEPLKYLKNLPNMTSLRLYEAYNGEELQFEKGSFPKLKELQLRHLERLKVVKIERGALPLLEELQFGPSPLMKEMPCDLQHLTNLKSLGVNDMPREFVKALQLDGGSERFKIQHISSVTFNYYTGKGIQYNRYKLSSPVLLQHLEEEQ